MPLTAPTTPAPVLAAASASPCPGDASRLHGLPPVVAASTVVLVLGSFPGVASLAAQRYYAHPYNQFWPLLQSLWPQHPQPPADAYAQRCEWLLARGLGLWDVYASCEREGSLDAHIRQPQLNDFAGLALQCPALTAVAYNGSESFKTAPRVAAAIDAARSHAGWIDAPLLHCERLPSTSPANAAWSFARKRQAWADLMAAHGLL